VWKVLEVAVARYYVPSAAAILARVGRRRGQVERPTGDPLRQIMAMGSLPTPATSTSCVEQFIATNAGSRSTSATTKPHCTQRVDRVGRRVHHQTSCRRRAPISHSTPTTSGPSTRSASMRSDRARDSRVPTPTRGFRRGSPTGRAAASRTCYTPQGGQLVQPLGALGDAPSGAYLAGGVAAALFKRERTGEPTVVGRNRSSAPRYGRCRTISSRRRSWASNRPVTLRADPEQRPRRIVPDGGRALDQP